jgi:preprotein translocase subunit SecG
MITVILVVHLLIAIALVVTVLLQRSEGGALGIGGGGGGAGGFMTGRSAANLLTRTTAVLAGLFFVTSLTLSLLAGNSRERKSILDEPAAAPKAEQPVQQEPPAQKDQPTAPLAR